MDFDKQLLARYKPGATITEKGFTSATDGGAPPYPGNVMFSILSKHGKHVAFLGNTGEEEVLFAPGTKFKVTKKVYDKAEEKWMISMIEQ